MRGKSEAQNKTFFPSIFHNNLSPRHKPQLSPLLVWWQIRASCEETGSKIQPRTKASLLSFLVPFSLLMNFCSTSSRTVATNYLGIFYSLTNCVCVCVWVNAHVSMRHSFAFLERPSVLVFCCFCLSNILHLYEYILATKVINLASH